MATSFFWQNGNYRFAPEKTGRTADRRQVI
jgi:hypothetical protein